jgi:lipopolysaccharide export LptBFGC system permease protein LptF
VFGKLRVGCGSSFLGGGVVGYGVLLFLGTSQGKLAFQLVTVFPLSSFLAFSMFLWYRAFLNVSSSGAVGLGL